MGFDLTARHPAKGESDYHRAGIERMAFLRSAMTAAGVPGELVFRKFVSNDHLLVTPRESAAIAERLTAWLRGRNLTLDIAEPDPRANVTLEALAALQRSVGNRQEAARLARRLRAKSLPIRLDHEARATVRAFAAFCAGSGGFHVD